MTQVFRACRKSEGAEGKTYWNDTGLKLLVGEWEGRPSYTIVDGRTGGKYSCFPIEKRQDTGQRQGGGDDSPGEREAPPHNDGVPF